jgi:hypothetical protein
VNTVMSLRLHTMLVTSWVAKQLSVSQSGMSSMELVTDS